MDNPTAGRRRSTEAARLIRMHPQDNVAIVANELGLPAGASLEDGTVLKERVPQGHKVALEEIPQASPVRRYDSSPVQPSTKDVNAKLRMFKFQPRCVHMRKRPNADQRSGKQGGSGK
jgi:hypothetical protein